MHGINQEAPAFDGIISGSDYKSRRVFVDDELDLWFEIEPDVFVFDWEQTRESARNTYGQTRARGGLPLDTLIRDYPGGKVLYDS